MFIFCVGENVDEKIGQNYVFILMPSFEHFGQSKGGLVNQPIRDRASF